ncbi:MAG: DUF5667 domain-containing protein, partial [Candidatus Aquicultor sp.]
MKPTITDIFNDCIDAIQRKQTTVEGCLRLHEDVRAELEPMLVAASRLLETGTVAPDSAKKRQAREALLAAVEQKRWETGVEREALKTAPALRRPRVLALGRRLSIITVICLALMGSTLAMAKESLPGSPFYPLKLAMEHARIGLTMDDTSKAKLYLNAADERMSELKRLKSGDPHYSELVRAVATNIGLAEKTSTDETDKEYSVAVSSLVKKNREVLERTLDKVPPSARPAIQRALTRPSKLGGASLKENDTRSGDSKTGNGSNGDSGYRSSASKHSTSTTTSGSSSKQRSQDSKDKNRTINIKINEKCPGSVETTNAASGT